MTQVRGQMAIVECLPLNGLLGHMESDIYTVPEMRQARVTALMLHNTHASNSNVAYLYMQPRDGTSRRILKQTLAAGKEFVLPPIAMNEGDKLRGYATNAAEVSFTLSRTEEYRV